jgi:hypothetical protein
MTENTTKKESMTTFEYALHKFDEQDLLDVIIDFANQEHDGHFTILSFTTGFKICFGTPCLDNSIGREQVEYLDSFKTIKEAMIHVILFNDTL